MDFSSHIARLLHEDHSATVEMIEGLESLIVKAKRTTPNTNDLPIQKILTQANQVIQHEVHKHFTFEENELFTRLAEFGDNAIGQHLTDEHRAILPVADQVAAFANTSLNDGFSDASWAQFSSLAGELIERMLMHIQKEEMALLPMLEEILDPETDMKLADEYMSSSN